MVDVTLCVNNHCPLRDKCYRYRAIPDKYWQSYSKFEPHTNTGWKDGFECDYFWQIDWVKDRILPTADVDNNCYMNRKEQK